MNIIKTFFRVEIDASEKSADIYKICDHFFGHVSRTN